MILSDSEKSSPIKVTFFGDSIFVGQGVSIYNGWVTKVAQSLDEYGRKIGRQILVSNASVNGRTTRQALEDMPYHVQSHGVDILVVQFGLNDCNCWVTDKGLPRVSLASFTTNLQEIILRGIHFGAVRVLLNNNHPTSLDCDLMSFTSNTYEENNRRYNKSIRDMAAQLPPQVWFQDIEQHFLDKISAIEKNASHFLLEDGLHLNDEGHTLYKELMLPKLLSAIDEIVSIQ